jgi:hypothetical protein
VEEVLRQAEMAEETNLKATADINGNHANGSASASIDADYEDGEIEDEDLEESMAPVGTGNGAAHESKDLAVSPPPMNDNTGTTRNQPSAAKGILPSRKNLGQCAEVYYRL